MRRIYYVFPKIQYPITISWAVVVMVELILFGIVIFLTERMAPKLNHDMAVYLRFGILVGAILLFTIVNLILATRLTHKIAGPLVQIQRVLNQARRGDFSCRVAMRSDDCMHEIGHSINLMLQGLEESKQVLRELHTSFQIPAGADSNRIKQMQVEKNKIVSKITHGMERNPNVNKNV